MKITIPLNLLVAREMDALRELVGMLKAERWIWLLVGLLIGCAVGGFVSAFIG